MVLNAFSANLVPAGADRQALQLLTFAYSARGLDVSEILDLNLIFGLGAGRIGKVPARPRRRFE